MVVIIMGTKILFKSSGIIVYHLAKYVIKLLTILGL